MIIITEEFIKIVLALFVGGVIGLEREYREKAAGFRTMILICLGSAIYTIISIRISGPGNDPGRIAAQIVSGIGFLGAGVIMRESGHTVGITTAASIWFVAALGMGLGSGEYLLVGISVLLALAVLILFPRFEAWINIRHIERTYKIRLTLEILKIDKIDTFVRRSGLTVHAFRKTKVDNMAVCTWATSGPTAAHARVVDGLLTDPDVREFDF